MVQLASEAVAPTRAVKLIVLDRDGVINHDSEQFIKSPDEWRPIPGSLEAIARLNHAGYRVVVATNQSGIGRGLFDMGMLNAIHEKMHKALAQVGGRVDAVFFCPHTADAKCECRKPKPGMLREIGRRFNVDMTGVPVHRRLFARPAGGGGGRRAADARADRQGREDVARRQFPEEHGDLPGPRVRGVGAARRTNDELARGQREPQVVSALRSLVFLLFQLVVTPFYAVGDAGARSGCRACRRYRIAAWWCRMNLWGARVDLRHPLAGHRPENIRRHATHRTS